ncbi:MAG: WecB/TagA/CpsF family glycosyltransferase [Eubacteriales bacterium]|nr:WecB/TagA/CpsF family glycosyltransferase [Eubacteriales bacterium]
MSFVTCDIIGVPINNVNMNEATSLVLLYMEEEKEEAKIVFTPNPEFVMNALKDDKFMNVLNNSDLNIADGIGIVIGSKMLGTPLKERVAGYDLTQNIFSIIKNEEKTVYFLGASEEIIQEAKNKMEKKYKGLKIIGVHNGYFSENEEYLIIEEINKLKPDLLLVGLGCPRQEKWIYDNKDKINAKVMIGVGGSFDVMSGNIKRAPKFFIKANLEWFYRLITQPTRIKRMLKLPLFLVEIIKYKFKGGKK